MLVLFCLVFCVCSDVGSMVMVLLMRACIVSMVASEDSTKCSWCTSGAVGTITDLNEFEVYKYIYPEVMMIYD